MEEWKMLSKMDKVMERTVMLWKEERLPEGIEIVDVSDWYGRDRKIGISGIAYSGKYLRIASPEQLRLIALCVRSKARWCVIARDTYEWWVIDLDTLRRKE